MFMFKHQKGILPRVLLIIGAVVVMFSAVIFILLSPEPRPLLINALKPPEDFMIRMLFLIFAVLLFFFGMYLAGLYPRILLTRRGLHYLGFMFYYGQLRWNEIDGLFELKNGTILISVAPKRLILFKGMFFQRLTGLLLGYNHPVLLLAPGLEIRDQIIEEIIKNSLVKKVYKFGDHNSGKTAQR